MEAQNERGQGLVAQLFHAWRFDHDLSTETARRTRRICHWTAAVLGVVLVTWALIRAEFSPHRTRESLLLALFSLLFVLVVRSTPTDPKADRGNAALLALWATMLLFGGICVVVTATSNARIGFPAGGLLGAGVFGLWRCRPRSRDA